MASKREKWLAVRDSGSLGQFYRSRSRYLHVSADVAMLPDPKFPEGPRIIPWTTPKGQGRTYRKGAR